MDKKRAIGGFLLSFVFLISFIYMISGVQWISDNLFQLQEEQNLLGSISDGVENIIAEDPVQIAAKPEISAESAISIETDLRDVNNIVYGKETEKKLPIASLTKLMTAVIVLEKYDLLDTAKVSKVADAQAPMKQDIKLGDNISVSNLLSIMIVDSSNKSAYALAELIGTENFVALMNKKAKEIGLSNTSFADPTGLSSKNISTVSDLSKLAKYILNNYPKIAQISQIKELSIPNLGTFTNTNQLLTEIPSVVCSKTGFTTDAKGCLLLVVNNPPKNDYLISVVLGSDDRFLDMKKIINWSSTMCK